MSTDIFLVNKDDSWINYLPRLLDDINNKYIIQVVLRLSLNHISLTKGFDIDKFLFHCNWLCIFNHDSSINEARETPLEMFSDLLANSLF